MRNVLLTLLLLSISVTGKPDERINLAGKWTVSLDSANIGIKESWGGKLYKSFIHLPGTTDDAKLGNKCTLKPALEKPQLLHLTRAYSYIGPAWYSKEINIPSDWNGKDYILHLERVLWDTQVWIDGIKVNGHEESLTTPHEYNLTPYLKSGKKHILTVRVDNRKRYDISAGELAHAYTDATQVKWNGILGDMFIKAVDQIRIDNFQLYPDAQTHSVKTVVTVQNTTDRTSTVTVHIDITGKKDKKQYASAKKTLNAQPGLSTMDLSFNLGKDAPLWNEFSPYLYKASAEISSENMSSEEIKTFGLRHLESQGNRLLLNGKPMFLRGTLECCIFPMTGTPPTDEKSWKKLFSAAREYGMNHLRFHSWCPPEAAFNAADEMGFYLQVELPVWSVTLGKDAPTIEFLRSEAKRISKEYGDHPSFCFWSLGNELQYDFNVMGNMIREMKKADDRHLYTTTSFTFEGGHGDWPEPDDDFFITQWTKKGWVRGQGVFNQEKPSFDKDFRQAIEGMNVPLITHEVGQYSVYPDLSEISKYKGTLIPLNFMAVKADLEKKGLIHKAKDYLEASGNLAAILYKEEIERALKTPGNSGFQLLDLHDFPGQGTALVGLLNAFWESKGIISGKEFREFCSPIVPLLRFPKAVYTNNETFTADVEICNYSAEELTGQTLIWKVKSGKQTLSTGQIRANSLTIGHNGRIGKIEFPLSEIGKASELEISVALKGTEYQNRWNIWVYPSDIQADWGEVKYTRNYEEAMALLDQGAKVLFNPDWRTLQGIEGKFVPVFWSPVHFPNQASTMGVLCDPKHPALADFPTEMHTDWQWWDLNINSTTMVVDSLKGGSPIVEMVDNFVNNRRLASLYEGSVGKGKLILATFDLEKSLDKRPVARQMLVSILKYMNSSSFNPAPLEGMDKIKDMFGTAENKKQAADGIY